MNLDYLNILAASIGGLIIAATIYQGKKSQGESARISHSGVTNSEYSLFFTIPVEVLGMAYYAVMALIYTALIIIPSLGQKPLLLFTVTALSLAGFLFSCYLTFIQGFVLHFFCKWCLSSAALATIVFLSVLGSLSLPIVDIMRDYSRVILTVHIIGLALGVGGATITDILFIKFLKDFRISNSESSILNTLSQVIWFALAVLVVSGIGLYLPNAELLNHTPKFLVKVIAVAVIIVNGAMLNLIVAPKLIKISFKKHAHENRGLHFIKRLSYALGAISITSWYTALTLGMIPRTAALDFGSLMVGYAAFIIIAVTASQFFDRHIAGRA